MNNKFISTRYNNMNTSEKFCVILSTDFVKSNDIAKNKQIFPGNKLTV